MSSPATHPLANPRDYAARRVVVAAAPGLDIARRIQDARPDLDVRDIAPAEVTDADVAWADTMLGFRVPPNITGLGNVRWVQSTGAGVDPWLVPGVLADHMLLTRSSELYGGMIAEWVLSRLFAIQLQVLPLYEAQQRTEWSPRPIARVAGTHAVLLGTGDIGRTTATALKALGVRTTGVSRSGTSAHPDFDRVVPVSELADMVTDADWIIVSTPDTPETRGLVSRDVLSRCRNAVLINAGRGAVVEESALPHALDQGWLRGAALDVFEVEPLPDTSPLWTDPRVIVSPHISGITTAAGAAQAFLDNLRTLESGAFPTWTVQRNRGY